jgi:chemotaxis protein methyltransferase CheR
MAPPNTLFPGENAAEEMPDDIYRALCQLVRDYCGLAFDQDSKFIVQKRVGKRMLALQMDDHQRYYYYLLYDRDGRQELETLVELLTTGETYFFREMNQLRAFTDEILPEILARRAKNDGGPVKLWSAGCASGEEPYTLAMLLLEKKYAPEYAFEIYATDLNRTLLHKARTGVFRENSFRMTEDRLRMKYFEPHDERTLRVRDEVKRMVTFGWVNLYDTGRPMVFGTVDVIFCRNVIIYFDKDGKKRVVDSFYDKLNPGGFLLLGHSESLLNISTRFALRHLKNDMVYQK